MAFNVEDLGTDARSADGWVVLFAIHKPIRLTGVLAVPATSPKAVAVRKLCRAIDVHKKLSEQLLGFCIEPRTVGKSRHPNVFEIKFAVRPGKEEQSIPLFLEFVRQCNVITNPIVSDMRNFAV